MNKCTFISLLACFFCLPSVNAQKSTGIEKDRLYLSPGIGVLSSYPLLDNGTAQYKGYTLKVPLISVSLDIALTRHWSVGPYLAYSASGHDTLTNSYQSLSFSYPATGYEFRRYNHYQFGSKTTYHFHILHQLAGYTGLILGYQRTTHSEPTDTHNRSSLYLYNENPRHLFMNVFVGARMPVSKHIAAFAEAGTYVTLLRFGCSAKVD